MKVDNDKCVSCGKCAKVCKMDVDVTKTPNHTECIRCGMCVNACPTGAVHFRYGFGDGKEPMKKTILEKTRRKQMKLKKLTALLLAALMVLALAVPARNGNTNTDTGDGPKNAGGGRRQIQRADGAGKRHSLGKHRSLGKRFSSRPIRA